MSSELQVKAFHFSDGFVKKLVELTEGAVDSIIFERVLKQLENETKKFYFTATSEANLIRVLSSVYDRAFFFQEVLQYPHHGEILIAISASSNYLTDIIVRNPEFLYQIFDQEYLSKKLEPGFLQKEIEEGTARFKTLGAKLTFIRQIKKRFILKIGLTDILGLDEIISITEQLSSLAKLINAKLFELCYSDILQKYNLQDIRHSYCICSLGKLGGNELNYSSDIDLILFYDFNGILPKIKKEYHEVLSEAIQLFVKSSSEISDRGFIYRVDFRLRPDGKNSQLCKTLNDYIKYYETRGEDWEKQMLIKLDFVGGNTNLYKRFHDFTQLYIYHTSLSATIKEKVRSMKLNIERHNEDVNVKAFAGGIRDIEFSIQALQMINGGRIKELKTGNTLNAIFNLYQNKLLTKKESETFTKAYIFYRRTEHFLQLMNDTQTHIIPQNSEMQNKLSKYLGTRSAAELKSTLDVYRKDVRAIYNKILKSEKSDAKENLLSSIKFKEAVKAEKNLKYLRSGAGIFERKEFDSRTIKLFNSVEPQLLYFLANMIDPDKVLDNFAKVIRATRFPSIWYSELSNLKVLKNFLTVCLYSQRAIDLLAINKLLEEYFLSGKAFVKNFQDDLYEMKTEEVIFISAVQFALGLIDSEKVSKVFSAFIQEKLEKLCLELNINYKYCLCGMGSFGSTTMNFASDVDLVVFVDDIDVVSDVQKDFQKFLAAAKNELKPFDVDFRLRPEGKSSPLVWNIKNYKNYLINRARIWEFQTLLKLKFVCGDKYLFRDFQNAIFEKAKSFEKDFIQKEVLEMYATVKKQNNRYNDGTFHIKKDRGGGLTVDFILQYFCLFNTKLYQKNIGNDTRSIIRALKKEFGEKEYMQLKTGFNFLKDLEVAIQNIFNTNQGIVQSNIEKKNLIASFLGMKSINELDKKINETVKSNNLLFDKYVAKRNH